MEFSETYQKSDFGQVWYYHAEFSKVKFALYVYDDDPTVIYMADVRTDESIRGQGYGNEILKEAEKRTLEKGYNTIELQVLDKSWKHEWYRRHGFSDLCYNEDDSNFIWMKKELY